MTDISRITAKLLTPEQAYQYRLRQQGRGLTKPTKLDRGIANKKATSEQDRKDRVWAVDVKKLDDYTDRYTGRRVKQVGREVTVIHPDAGHAHHIEPRENEDVRYDVRNGVCLSFATHDAVERGKLRIVGTRFFRKSGRRYVNGREPVKFVVVK